MQGTRGLPSVSFIKQALPVIGYIYLMTRIVLVDCVSNQFSVESK